MKRLFIAFWLLAVGSLEALATDPPGGRSAPLLGGLGDHHHPISTTDPRAQRFFDQGLILTFAFNHAEAERAYREAARLDPRCAMCWWGAALVLGPNINAPMEDVLVPRAYATVQKALEMSGNASEKEQAYIKALAKRYAPGPTSDRGALDRAYAEAMRALARRYPNDLDAQVLTAEALMDLHPWDYWRDGQPQPWTPEIVAILERVLERQPDHPHANHLYIHAMEASPHPERAEPSADRLRDLVPGAGHLVHMPAHIYINIGRYGDAALANERAIEVDREYMAQVEAQGLYVLAYVPHNRHFLWAAASMAGRSEVAIEAAQEMAAQQDPQRMRQPGLGTLQHYWITPLYAFVRFGKWNEILAVPEPAEDLLYPRGVWHYARGMAFARKGNFTRALAELKALSAIAAEPSVAEVTIWDVNNVKSLLGIAVEALSGEIAAEQGNYDKAIRDLERAVRLEDALNYDEPASWHFPTRQSLGAVLIEAGKPQAAEKVYREDLDENNDNGWSLFGLYQSLQAQGRQDEARQVKQRFDKAWASADVALRASRF